MDMMDIWTDYPGSYSLYDVDSERHIIWNWNRNVWMYAHVGDERPDHVGMEFIVKRLEEIRLVTGGKVVAIENRDGYQDWDEPIDIDHLFIRYCV